MATVALRPTGAAQVLVEKTAAQVLGTIMATQVQEAITAAQVRGAMTMMMVAAEALGTMATAMVTAVAAQAHQEEARLLENLEPISSFSGALCDAMVNGYISSLRRSTLYLLSFSLSDSLS